MMALRWMCKSLLLSPLLITGPLPGADLSILQLSSLKAYAYGQDVQSVRVKIRVPNRSFEKNVAVIFQREEGAPQRVIAHYQGPADTGYEIWEAQTHLGPGNRFVRVEYAEAGPEDAPAPQTRWFLRDGSGPVLYDERRIFSIYETPVLDGDVLPIHAVVQNLAYAKRVQVHVLEMDSERVLDLCYQPTFQNADGSARLPNAEGFEIWSVRVPIDPAIRTLRYYLSYEVGGQVFVDDNFGHLYQRQRSLDPDK